MKKLLHVELYNEKHFKKSLQTSTPSFNYKHDIVQLPNELLPPFVTLTKLYDNANTCPPDPLFDKVDDNISNPPSHLVLHKILITIDFFFFIKYIPEDNVKYRWFLVEVNYVETDILKMDSLRTENMFITFLYRCLDNNYIYDDAARW